MKLPLIAAMLASTLTGCVAVPVGEPVYAAPPPPVYVVRPAYHGHYYHHHHYGYRPALRRHWR
jgi:hypothetical protein